MTDPPNILATRPVIVVADRDPDLLNGLAFRLKSEGYSVEQVEGPLGLLAREFGADPLCLVVDQDLPGISGLEALAILRARGIGWPAILMASKLTPRLLASAAERHIEVLQKPILDARLLAAVRACWTG